MWKYHFLLFAIVGISVGSAKHLETKEEFKTEFTGFDDKQETAMKKYAETYHQAGLHTFEKVVKKYTIPKHELTTDLCILGKQPEEANVDDTDELARIGQKFKKQQIMMESVQNATMLSKDFKYLAVILMIRKESSPIVKVVKQIVTDLIKATKPEDQEKHHKHLYDYFGDEYEPFYLQNQAWLEVVESYYENPKFFKESQTVKINNVMKRIRDSMKKWNDVNELESNEDLESLMELFPDFLKGSDDLKRELELAKVHCDLSRCTNHPESSQPKIQCP